MTNTTSSIPPYGEAVDLNDPKWSADRLVDLFPPEEMLERFEEERKQAYEDACDRLRGDYSGALEQGDVRLRDVVRTDIDESAHYVGPCTLTTDDFEFFKETERGQVLDRNEVIRYCISQRVVYDGDQAYRFDGCIYRKASDLEVQRLINSAVESQSGTSFLTRTALGDLVHQVKLHATADDIPCPDSFLEDDRYEGTLIPFRNGLYNVDKDILLPFTHHLFITHILGTEYRPSVGECPEAERAYAKIIRDPDTRDFFFEMVGYMLFSERITIPAIFVIYGPGNTGKSALQTAITTAMGVDNISNLDLAQISATFTTAEMCGKLLNVCGETGAGIKLGQNVADGQLLKKLSEGQKITVQRKNSQPFDMIPTAKLMFVTNTPPNFNDTSSGMLRRLYIMPCRSKQEWTDQVYDKLTSEDAQAWLVNRALRGYLDFLQRGNMFKPSEQMKRELTAFRAQDPMDDYLLAMYGSIEPSEVRRQLRDRTVSDEYYVYSDYVRESGGKPVSRRKFTEYLRNEFGLTTRKKSFRTGIGNTSARVFCDEAYESGMLDLREYDDDDGCE